MEYERRIKMLTNKEIIAIHELVYRLYGKYPSYVHFDLAYSTNNNYGTTLPPTKEMRLNIYTPLINHNHFSSFSEFKEFIEKLLAEGIPNVRIKLLDEKVEASETQIANAKKVICSAKKELLTLKKMV